MPRYIYRKTQILKQLNVQINAEQMEKLLNLKSEIAIDNYTRNLILKGNEQNNNN